MEEAGGKVKRRGLVALFAAIVALAFWAGVVLALWRLG